ncbi:MAG: type I restriction enzyme HsdR N-terminal domain-containing protein [Bacteroidetes bacterium]|nr:type I restriction enzyme HsdR N-terminal domain-containing protein [Bacteroidota bacterium]
MVIIRYPEPSFRIKKETNRELIFDVVRKKWVALTPEEWVRQNFISYLIAVKKYPSSLIAVEKEIQLGELKKRFDILVYDTGHHPWMMVECKSIEVGLDERVLQQLLRYNISVPVQYMVITNGKQCFAWERRESRLEAIFELPLLIK